MFHTILGYFGINLVQVVQFVFVGIFIPSALSWLKITITAQAQGYLTDAVEHAINDAVLAHANANGKSVPQVITAVLYDGVVRADILRLAQAYITSHDRWLLKVLRLCDPSPAGALALQQKINSRVLPALDKMASAAQQTTSNAMKANYGTLAAQAQK